MTSLFRYDYQGELVAPLYPMQPVLARNHVFPLNSEFDFEIQATLDNLPDRPSFVPPSVLYQFIRDLLREFTSAGVSFDLILIRLGAPILENMPDELLAPNVFISVDNEALLDLTTQQGCRRVLCINQNFLVHYVNDFGDNRLGLTLYHDQALSAVLEQISSFLKNRNVHGAFSCL